MVAAHRDFTMISRRYEEPLETSPSRCTRYDLFSFESVGIFVRIFAVESQIDLHPAYTRCILPDRQDAHDTRTTGLQIPRIFETSRTSSTKLGRYEAAFFRDVGLYFDAKRPNIDTDISSVQFIPFKSFFLYRTYVRSFHFSRLHDRSKSLLRARFDRVRVCVTELACIACIVEWNNRIPGCIDGRERD